MTPGSTLLTMGMILHLMGEAQDCILHNGLLIDAINGYRSQRLLQNLEPTHSLKPRVDAFMTELQQKLTTLKESSMRIELDPIDYDSEEILTESMYGLYTQARYNLLSAADYSSSTVCHYKGASNPPGIATFSLSGMMEYTEQEIADTILSWAKEKTLVDTSGRYAVAVDKQGAKEIMSAAARKIHCEKVCCMGGELVVCAVSPSTVAMSWNSPFLLGEKVDVP
eukprot:Protomagalhaensia_wolfi_Nauph_80__4660@NODE_482_length_2451_cov_83_834577_g362_i0_p2_GENE_NODE_482_length_2451_cov_83_834577_g362_i0NODE_482_length_2451_cov_83_834577_g362_i0_p2_ORF_typecomplete_len224_score44_69Flavi_NS2B/PF01002_19/0_0062_NODE_482_length_2451_cov_83_834577_g362_i014982169